VPTCKSCFRQVRATNTEGLCLGCRVEPPPTPPSSPPRTKSTQLFLSTKEAIPLLTPVVHHAHVVETTSVGLTRALMYCGLETKEVHHKWTFQILDVTCEACLRVVLANR
jgi:hypothetical protein